MSIESVMPSNHLILSHPLLLPSMFPSIRVFSNESALHIRWPKYWSFRINSVQFSCSVVSNSLRPQGLQHTRPPCPSPTPGVYPNSCPLSQWCHPTISSSVIHFSFLQTLPALGSFPMRQFYASFPPKNTQGWSPSQWTGWISLQSKWLSGVFSNTTVQKHQFLGAQLSSRSNSHPYMTTEKTIALTRQTFVGKVMSLLLNMLSRLVITFLPRSKHLLISWLQLPSAVILEPPKDKVWHCFHKCLRYCQLSHRVESYSELRISNKSKVVKMWSVHLNKTFSLWYMLLSLFSRVRLCATPQTAAH